MKTAPRSSLGLGSFTRQHMDKLEAAGYQFLKDDKEWALYDIDTRQEVPGSRSHLLGKAIWKSCDIFGF